MAEVWFSATVAALLEVKTGASSSTSVTLMLTSCVLALPKVSVAVTVNVQVFFISKSGAVLKLITPVLASMLKSVLSPPLMAQETAVASVAVTVMAEVWFSATVAALLEVKTGATVSTTVPSLLLFSLCVVFSSAF